MPVVTRLRLKEEREIAGPSPIKKQASTPLSDDSYIWYPSSGSQKRVRDSHSTTSKALSYIRFAKDGRATDIIPGIPYGSGSYKDPIRIPLRDVPNQSGCLHCPLGIDKCDCGELQTIIWNGLRSVGLNRKSGHREANAKSILPVLVSRLVNLMKITDQDVFWDLGCGNGSVVMQVALQTGATVVGVEIQEENIHIAERVWPLVRTEWSKRHPDRPVGNCIFVAADMFEALGRLELPTPTTAWAANLLFGPLLNHRLGEKLIDLSKLRAVCVMKDLYPRYRSYAMKRNPEPFVRFPRMELHEWQPGSVEWSAEEIQVFNLYAKSY